MSLDHDRHGTRLGQPGLYQRDHEDAGRLRLSGDWAERFDRAVWLAKAQRAVDRYAGHAL